MYKNFSIQFTNLTPPMVRMGTSRRKKIGGLGRKRSMCATTALVVSMSWYRTRGSVMLLCIIFGITHSVCVLFLRFARRILDKVLSKCEQARVKMPDANKIGVYKGMVNE